MYDHSTSIFSLGTLLIKVHVTNNRNLTHEQSENPHTAFTRDFALWQLQGRLGIKSKASHSHRPRSNLRQLDVNRKQTLRGTIMPDTTLNTPVLMLRMGLESNFESGSDGEVVPIHIQGFKLWRLWGSQIGNCLVYGFFHCMRFIFILDFTQRNYYII